MGRDMQQLAPFPEILAALVERMAYRPGWEFSLEDIDRGQGSEGLTFIVTSLGYNSYHPDRGETYRVHHYFPVPPAAYDARSWRRWLFERLLEVERHECAEFFQLTATCADCHGEGSMRGRRAPHGAMYNCETCGGTGLASRTERPYAPHHGPGNDPYIIFEHGTDEDVRTSFRGEVKPAAGGGDA